ncbi:hypothetical protein HF086_007277 [Spodoptera exigua]|uniref:F-box domain-containing protein n=1 Tax=Spodoptera exigua TaxID=7107 RepID=A0A922MP89_SPOEX|nr:hypothetical protein HF086_007277 [Spodoptera exigua]
MYDYSKMSRATSFAELTKQVHLINDLILADMACEDVDNSKAAVTFSKHLLATKYWFARISYANKKRRHVYSSFDQVPMDHNRTAQPGRTLAQVMKSDRLWFLALDPLDANLATWNATIKSMRDSLKLEEIEMIFNDGSKRKIWKVNRVKPEVTETVDFIQMLPSAIGKRILSYLPRAQLGEYARVNKYWAYLVDELKAELATRAKIDTDFEKFHELLLRHDTSLEFYTSHDDQYAPPSSQGWSLAPSKGRQPLPSTKASERSAGAYSLRHFLPGTLVKPMIVQKPIRNMADLKERLERRGATDENIWKWCDCLLAHAKKIKQIKEKTEYEDGVLCLGTNVHFPCPLMKVSMEIPLIPPMVQDPIISTTAKPRKNLSECTLGHVPKEITKRISLWTRDLSTLYHVYKIPSYLNTEFPTVTLPAKFHNT